MSKKDIQGILVISLLIIAVVSGIVWAKWEQEASPRIDPVTLCPTDRAGDHTIMMVDRTDALTKESISLFRLEVSLAKDRLEVGERFSIFPVEANGAHIPKPIFSVCRPSQGSDEHWFTGKPKTAQQHFDEHFEKPLDDAIAELAQPAETRRTALFESIRNIYLLPSFSPAIERRRLILLSDLLANTPELSFYKTQPDYQIFLKSEYAQQVYTNLSGVKVKIVQLPNRKAAVHQTPELLTFWHSWFDGTGALREEGGYTR